MELVGFSIELWALVTLLITLISILYSRRNGVPGPTFFLPLIGETFEYASPNRAVLFMEKRIHRYGKLFKSHLFGDPVVVSCCPKMNRFILQEEFKHFESSYPKSFVTVMGKKNLSNLNNQELHKHVRGMVIKYVASNIRSDKYIQHISSQIETYLRSWEGRVILVHEEAAKLAYRTVAKRLIGFSEDDLNAKYLMQSYFDFIKGLISVPINLPGTVFYKSLKARDNLIKSLEKTILNRKKNRSTLKGDFLDALIVEEEQPNGIMTREMTIDSMVSVMFAAHDTMSKAMSFVTKLILDNPKVLETLRKEHKDIQENVQRNGITWEDYQSMKFTHNVVQETLRLLNIAPGVFRKAVKDVSIDGCVIPKGSKILVYFTKSHLDSMSFKDPLNFDPWRWENITPSEVHFMPFGGGPRLCPGKELGKVHICIYIHHLVLNYRFKQIEEDEIMYTPYLNFKRGLPIMFQKID